MSFSADDRCRSLNSDCLFFDQSFEKTWFDARHHCNFHQGDLFFLRKGEDISDILSFLFVNWPKAQDLIHIGLQHQKWLWAGRTDFFEKNIFDFHPVNC